MASIQHMGKLSEVITASLDRFSWNSVMIWSWRVWITWTNDLKWLAKSNSTVDFSEILHHLRYIKNLQQNNGIFTIYHINSCRYFSKKRSHPDGIFQTPLPGVGCTHWCSSKVGVWIYTLPEANKSWVFPMKINGWKMECSCWDGLFFRGELLVSWSVSSMMVA